jgi:hypothetical protein
LKSWPSGNYPSYLKVISEGGRGSIANMRPNQREILESAVDEFLVIKYGDAMKFKRPTSKGRIYSCIPNDAIDQFNEWLDERIIDGKLIFIIGMLDTNEPKKSGSRVKDYVSPPIYIEEPMTIWPAGNIFLIESY